MFVNKADGDAMTENSGIAGVVRPDSSLVYKPPAPEAVMPNNGYLIAGLTLGVVQ